jgi:GTPase SAR1 family protein
MRYPSRSGGRGPEKFQAKDPILTKTYFDIIEPVLIGALVTVALGFLTSQLARQRLPVAYSIAVLGFPRSGKTTLITAMFGELFANKILGYRVFPRGQSTIERINSDLENLELGRNLGPTTDQDLFAYRADVVRDQFLISRIYKVEVGDFPGEDSIAFAEAFGDWFHQTPYFRWAMAADAFIFVVDLKQVLDPVSSREYVARVSKAIRAAWQRLQENHIQGEKALFAKPVALVFTKADLFGENIHAYDMPFDLEESRRLRFGSASSGREDIDPKAFETGTSDVVRTFTELIDYLNSQARGFDVFFVSAFAYQGGRRIGVKNLLRFILPTPSRTRARRLPERSVIADDRDRL